MSPSERDSKEGDSDTNSRHSFDNWRGREEEEGEEGLGDRRRLDAAPPSSRKRPPGVRPFAGRSPPRDAFQLQREHKQDGEGSMVPQAEREGKRGSSNDGDSGCKRDEYGTDDADRRRRPSAAAEAEDETLQCPDTNATMLRTRSSDNELNYATSRKASGGHGANAETVRILAESFVDDVLDGLSSPVFGKSSSLK